MRVSRDILLAKVLQHKEAFYTLLDYIAQHRGAYEIPQSLYLREYRQHILPSGDDQAIRLLTLDSLNENGLFFHLDNQVGTATLHAWLVDMLRFTDTSRMRELSNSDFESLRAQFQTAVETFEMLPIAPGDTRYEEEKLTLYELIDTTLSRIQGNVEALMANADRLGEDFDRLDTLGHGGADSRKLLESASDLYERFIRPCLEFLSPSLGLKNNKKSFTESMERLAELHENAAASTASYRLLFKLTAVRSYFKDIADIERQVQRYCRSLEEERQRFRAIEASYNKLLESVEALRHGKLRHTQLSPADPLFRTTQTFLGLHTHSGRQAQKLNWYDAPNRIWLEEWVESIGEPADSRSVPGLQAVSPPLDVGRQRRELVTRLCIRRDMGSPCEDIVENYHRWLPRIIDDYTLKDLIIAYQVFMGLADIHSRLTWSRKRRRVDDGQYYFDYLAASYQPAGEAPSQ